MDVLKATAAVLSNKSGSVLSRLVIVANVKEVSNESVALLVWGFWVNAIVSFGGRVMSTGISEQRSSV